MRRVNSIGGLLDEIFSGYWWWRARRFMAERRLERVLKSLGDKSMGARNATERCREMQFAVAYWRSAPAAVRQVVGEARRAGANVEDLKLIVLNTDLRVRGSEVALRRSTLVRVLSAAFATIIGVHWTLMCSMIALAPGTLWLKVAVLFSLWCVYATLYRGWSLYAFRSLASIQRSGVLIDQICRRANVGASGHVRALELRARP